MNTYIHCTSVQLYYIPTNTLPQVTPHKFATEGGPSAVQTRDPPLAKQ